MTESQLDVMAQIEEASRYSLTGSTVTFVYLFFHLISHSFLRSLAQPLYGIQRTTVQTIISFGVPLLPTMIAFAGLIGLVYHPVNTVEDLSVNISPTDLRVYQEYHENDQVLIEVFNKGDQAHTLDLTIEMPEKMVVKVEGEEYTDEYSNEFTISDDRESFHLSFGHIYSERMREIVRVNLDHDYGSISKEIVCDIRS